MSLKKTGTATTGAFNDLVVYEDSSGAGVMGDILGAQLVARDGVAGTSFRVWAPNATEVSVLTDDNGWQHGRDRLNSSDTGVWEGFIPGASHGTTYKFSIRTRDGQLIDKSDPFACYTELPPKTAAIVYDLDQYKWGDESWLINRASSNWLEQPVSIYEVHLASWKRPWDERSYHNYRELAVELVSYVKDLSYTHIELMPVSEFPFDGSWGYQVTNYMAPTSRFGTPDDFRYFIEKCHDSGIGVIVDWVPAHFPSDAHGLARFDGTALYEHEDPRRGYHPDWQTCIFNYGRSEVRDFLTSSAKFWIENYHIDGLRVDAVSSMLYLDYSREDGEWIPNEHGGRENLEAISFLKDLNTQLHGEYPGILIIAEESTAWGGVSRPVFDGGLGFTMKWDMGWMHDSLSYISRDPIHRKHHQGELSFRSIYAFSENFVLPLSHDEVVHGKGSLLEKMPGDDWQKFANLRLLYGYQYTTPGKKLLFMGSEFGQRSEWNHDEQLNWELLKEPLHDSLRRYVGDLNRVYRDHPALYELDCSADGFSWIDADDADHSIYKFCRFARNGETIVVVLNFSPEPQFDYCVGVPHAGNFVELLNSDAEIYGGSNIGNLGDIKVTGETQHGRPYCISINVPPLGMLVLKQFDGQR